MIVPTFKTSFSIILLLVHTVYSEPAQKFSSYITVNTPARSYSHGVGQPIGVHTPKKSQRKIHHYGMQSGSGGYRKAKPAVPFIAEDIRFHDNNNAPWLNNNFLEVPIPLYPASPYKVDSPDPESLWPEGLFPNAVSPTNFGQHLRRNDNEIGEVLSEKPAPEFQDPYLLEGSEAVAAIEKSSQHGLFYFHDISHIESLLENQQLRTANQLEPHRLGSIRHKWPYYRV